MPAPDIRTPSSPRAGRERANEPVLSVVLPNHNHAHYLPRALRALLAQQRKADEIIVIDDCSTDDSRSVIERFAAADTSIRLYLNERNRGALYSLQRGLETARGRYVYFAAADDYVLPGFFQTALDLLAKHPECGLCCTNSALFDGKDKHFLGFRPVVRPLRRTGSLSAEGTTRLLRKADNFILTGSSVIRRDFALEAGGFDPSVGSFADGLLARRIALRHGLCYTPITGAVWNVFSDSLSRTTALAGQNALAVLETVPGKLACDPMFPAGVDFH